MEFIYNKLNAFVFEETGGRVSIARVEFFENKTIKSVIQNVSKQTNLQEFVIKNIIAKELGYIKEQD